MASDVTITIKPNLVWLLPDGTTCEMEEWAGEASRRYPESKVVCVASYGDVTKVGGIIYIDVELSFHRNSDDALRFDPEAQPFCLAPGGLLR